jgi:hypothetical protein
MATSTDRIRDDSGSVSAILWVPWERIPESVLVRLPELRSWQERMILRDQANQQKIVEELVRLQITLKDVG